MSSGDVQKITPKDIEMVQHLIERCLQQYMSQKEAVSCIEGQAKVEPVFTEIVWQRLEIENPVFFKAYNQRLEVKEQVLEFNRLLEKQAELMGVSARVSPMAKGKNKAPVLGKHIGAALNPGNMQQQPIGAFTNGGSGSSFYPTMQTSVDMSVHPAGIGISPNMMFTQQSNVGSLGMMIPGIMNSENMIPDAGYENVGSLGMMIPGIMNSGNMIPDAGNANVGSLGMMIPGIMNSGNMIPDAGYENVGSLGMMIPGIMNSGNMIPDAGYANSSSFTYGVNDSVLQTPFTVENPPFPSFSNVESYLQFPSQMMLDPDTSSLGSLSQVPQNLNMLDSNTYFYDDAISPFLATDDTDLDMLLESHGRGQHQGPTATVQDTSFHK